jgi:hypothetical protein
MALVASGMLRSQGYRTLQTRSAPAPPQVYRRVVAQVGEHECLHVASHLLLCWSCIMLSLVMMFMEAMKLEECT